MKKEKINVGDEVVATVKEDMKKSFTGVINKIYENSALVDITAFDDEDEDNVVDLNYRTIVNFNDMKPAKKKG